jgi:hypothetical protein
VEDCVAITDAGLKYITSLKKLKHLELTQAINVTEEALWQNLSGLVPQLRVLNLGNCDNVGDTTLFNLASLDSSLLPLQSLTLTGCRLVSGKGLGYLAQHLDGKLGQLTSFSVDISIFSASNLRPFRERGIHLQ